MRQVICSLRDGQVTTVDVPAPVPQSGEVLIRTTCSLVSAGTERMLVNFGLSSPLQKIQQNPDRFNELLNKVRSDGIVSASSAVASKLDKPIPLGYSSAGVVIGVGSNVTEYKIGDRVISNGAHAEIVRVPKNLCAKIPDSVSDEQAVFTVLASISLQSIRLSSPTFGETYLVIGLGLLGLLTVKLLRSHGCSVLAVDPDINRCSLASTLGANVLQLTASTDPIAWSLSETNNIGVDSVIIAASTSTSDPLRLACESSRKRARIVLVGTCDISVDRELLYKKELSFQVSCSYGPGRYDPFYEKLGNDYPISYVRWTEQRNFSSVLSALDTGLISTSDLITHRFSIEQVADAYELLTSRSNSLGILITYREALTDSHATTKLRIQPEHSSVPTPSSNIAVIGAGNYCTRILLPALRKTTANLSVLCSVDPVSTLAAARKFGFSDATTDPSHVFGDETIASVVIATRHDSHAKYVLEALANKKHTFVEKPLCLNLDELHQIQNSYNGNKILMCGFNRRFAPLVQALKRRLDALQAPFSFIYTCNAGYLPSNHWLKDPTIGGGRLLGEACHFVDLLLFLSSSSIEQLSVTYPEQTNLSQDTFSINLRFANGSIGVIHYSSLGHKSYPKERLDVFAQGKVYQLTNYRKLKAWGDPSFRNIRTFRQDKGHFACSSSFVHAIANNTPPPIPVNELFEVHRHILEALQP